MSKKHQGRTGLADLKDGRTGENINFEDFISGAYLRDLKESNIGLSKSKNKVQVQAKFTQEKNTLPSKYNGKNWDDLYRSDELETIRTQHPEHYEKLRKERFKTKD